MRRSPVALLAVAFLPVAFLPGCGKDREPPPAVVVHVLDQDAKPVADAEVQAKYAPGWQKVAPNGTARLKDVPLRAGEEATPAAIVAAIDLRSEFHALRGDPLAVRAGEGWDVTLWTQRHGVLRLHVQATRFTNVEAWADAQPGLVEAVGETNVSRPMQPSTWRVFPGAKEVVLHLKGDAPMAWETQVIEAPSPGFLREEAFLPRASVAIGGTVVAPDPAPPTLAGQVHVTELRGDGSRTKRESVVVADDGGFTVPYVGPGTYELVPDCPFLASTAPVIVKAGEFAEVASVRGRPWLEVDLPGMDDEQRASTFAHIEAEGAGLGRVGVVLAAGFRWGGRLWLVGEPGAKGDLFVDARGSDRSPPREGRLPAEFPSSGGQRVTVETKVRPHGTASVRAGAAASGARVEIDGREKSVLAGLGDTTWPNLAVGDHTAHVTYPHSKGTADLPLTVREGETTVLEVPPK